MNTPVSLSSIDVLPSLISHYRDAAGQMIPVLQQQIEDLFPGDVLKNTGRILLTGSGENYPAVLAGRSVFTALSPYPAEWVETMTPAALHHFYEREKLRFGSAFVIAVDYEGTDCRLPAAAEAVHDEGGRILLITSQPDCPAAQKCDWVLALPSAGVSLLPETECFFSGYLALLLLGRAMGIACEILNEEAAAAMTEEILRHLESVGDASATLCSRIRDDAVRCADAANFDIIASGRDYPAGYLTRMLCYRRLGQVVTLEESEDWLHVNMLALDPHQFLTLFFVSEANPSADRTLRTIAFAKELGRQVVTVSDANFGENSFVNLPASRNDLITPLTLFMPASVLIEILRLSH